MANIRIKDLPPGPAPLITDVVAVDGGQTRPNTFGQIRDLLAPFYASASQGALAASALQPGYQPTWTSITGKPTFFSGAYADLTGKPTLGLLAAKDTVAVGDVSATGTPSSTTYLRGDGSWSTPAGGGGGGGDMFKATYDPTNINSSAFDRANHTGTQVASTISNFSTAADARVSSAIGVSVQAYATNLTTWAGIAPATGIDTFLATPTSANLRAALTDEVGTGAAYFVGGALGTPASGTATNLTGLPIIAGTTGTLTVARGGTGLATLTSNNLLVGAGTGNVTFIAPGASGNVLTSNGTNWASSAPAGTPGLILLSTQTVASAVAAVDFTTGIDSTYDEYLVAFLNVVPASASVLNLLTSANAGGAWETGASAYGYTLNFVKTSAVVASGADSAAAIPLTPDGVHATASNGGVSGRITLVRPSVAAAFKHMRTEASYLNGTASQTMGGTGSAVRKDSSAVVNGLRFIFASGNVSSGVFRLYGVRKV